MEKLCLAGQSSVSTRRPTAGRVPACGTAICQGAGQSTPFTEGLDQTCRAPLSFRISASTVWEKRNTEQR